LSGCPKTHTIAKLEIGGHDLYALNQMNSALNPTDLTVDATLQTVKAQVWQALDALPGDVAGGAIDRTLAAHFHPECAWHTSHPINELSGLREIGEKFWAPFLAAFPDLERRTDIFFGGEFDGRFVGGAGTWVCATGHYVGTFTQHWLGIPAHGAPAFIRFGEFYRVANGRIVEARVLLDLVGLMRQAGHPVLPASTGLDLLVPGPHGHDGLLLAAHDPAAGQHTHAVLQRMIDGLMAFDQHDLKSMGMEQFWHPRMMWYGPSGIGTTRAIAGFQQHHQAPFLRAFPDRKGAGHRARIAEGNYVASTGWPSVRATHAADYLGVPATGKPITMRVMDWWRRDGELLRENWVFIDLPHLMLQMGVDLFARLPRE
jgi:predicted ester cyclase